MTSHKACSICGKSYLLAEFSYGNREMRSYCRSCSKLEKAAYAKGGTEAARQFRESQRARWKH
jgi:ribosomal protein S27AE